MSYNNDVPVFKCKWLEMYFGLFGPCLTYHTSGVDDDNAKLVISLIFCKLYFTLLWSHKNKGFDFYAVYGFHSVSEPDRIIFQWGSDINTAIYKSLTMPWVMNAIKRRLLDVHGDVVETVKESEFYKELEDVETNYCNYATLYGHAFKYYTVIRTLRPQIMKRLNLDWFDKTDYEIHVIFDNRAPFAGYYEMCFKTDFSICALEQIGLQMAMRINGCY